MFPPKKIYSIDYIIISALKNLKNLILLILLILTLYVGIFDEKWSGKFVIFGLENLERSGK